MRVYGYCRKSTKSQNIERQIRNIKAEYPNAVIVQEAYSGTTMNRKAWQKLNNTLKDGDTVIFDSVSRMSRNADEGFAAYEELFRRGVELVFLKEPHINTATFKSVIDKAIPMTGTNIDFILEGVNKYLMALAKEQIRIAFEQSEKEVEDLHQRTKEGIETARLHGKQIGQKKGTTLTTKKSIIAKDSILKHSKNFGGELTDVELIRMLGISRNSFYKYKRELSEGAC